jgi:hypothetical protein
VGEAADKARQSCEPAERVAATVVTPDSVKSDSREPVC